MFFTATTASAWSGGGTLDNPYQIASPADLNQLASGVNGGTEYAGVYFKLTNDITYTHSSAWNDSSSTENNFTPIGGFQKFFSGNFDGNGKTVSGIRIYLNNNDHGDILRGLFGCLTNTANIHDLTLADTRITGYNTVGGIVGISEGIINNCHVANNVAIRSVYNKTLNTYSFGGIAGSNAGTITSCTSAVQISISGTNGTCYGAIAGDNTFQGRLTNNFANGATIPAASDSTYGAIAGYNYDGTLTRNLYTNCTVAGTPNATGVGCNNSDETEDGGALPSTLLSGSAATEMTVLPGGWYIVTGNNITYSGELNFTGDINLVLADGAHLTINCGYDFALNANGHTLTIYGQTNGTGALTANATGSGVQAAAAIRAGNIIVNGGNITAHTTGDRGIAAIEGDVTINGGTVNATGGTYGIYAHNTITLAGGKVNANSYSTTARVKDGLFYFDNNGTYYSGTLSDADKTAIAGETISPIHIDPITDVSYIDQNGTKQPVATVAKLKSNSNQLSSGWYMADSDLTIGGNVTIDGNVHLILKNSSTLNINEIGDVSRSGNLTIYSQSESGATGNLYIGRISADNLTINGGVIRSTTAVDNVSNFYCNTITINGGQISVWATGPGSNGLEAVTITLGFSREWANNFIESSTYLTSDVRIADGQTITNGTAIYSGQLSVSEILALANQTLRPCLALANNADNSSLLTDNNGETRIAALKDRTLYKDGAWNTLCLPFNVEDGNHNDQVTFSGTPLEGATVMTLSTSSFDQSNGTLTLNFAASDHIGAGVPYIIKWDKPEGYDAHPENFDIHNPVFSGVNVSNEVHNVETSEVFFLGCFSPVEIGMEDRTKLYLTAGNNLCFPGAAMTIGSCRAYFQLLNGLIAADLAGSGNAPGRIVLNFGEDHTATTVQSVDQTDKGRKFLRNNQLYILREGVLYDALGRKVQ